jgi:diguanylate cyclase (GGDEF)-like protein
MPAAQLPANEAQRLDVLSQYRILDTLAEQAYDDITLLASHICEVPIALVSFVDKDRQFLKSKVGLDVSETSREVAFCAHAILSPGEVLEVRDATKDARFADNPFVMSEPRIRFYAGAPLVSPSGAALGTVCVIDKKPRELTQPQSVALQALSRQVVSQLELRKALEDLGKHMQERASYEQRLEAYQLRLEEINASLSIDSQTDKLTGLSNRRYFDEILAEEHDRACRRGKPLSLLMLDVDHFKSFNDTFGHSAGDQTLRVVAKILADSKRTNDHVARYGGEEFVALLPDTTEEGAVILAERIRKGIQNYNWQVRPVTVSVGVCTFPGGDSSPSQLIEGADAALYVSKEAGRNRVTLGSLV